MTSAYHGKCDMNPEARACIQEDAPDCKHIRAEFLHYWCGNESCCKMRGTDHPTVFNCLCYEPEKRFTWSNCKLYLCLYAGILALGATLTFWLDWILS
jgi:hypothetical protein